MIIKKDLKNKTRNELETIIINMDERIDSYRNEVHSLQKKIKEFEDVCDGNCFAKETDDQDEKIAKMQDRIDSDCVRINRLKVTINTLVDMYGLLRNQVGMD